MKTPTERFIFSDFKPQIHRACFWDEFKIPSSVDALRQALEGEPVPTETKGGAQTSLRFRVPIIMVSNKSFETFLEECGSEVGLRERIEVVCADD